MTVAVEPVGFDTAAEAYAMGNAVAAQFYGELREALAGYGMMAGDDKTSEEFAASYDTAAAAALGAARDLVGALAGLARLTSASGMNHRHANVSSVYAAHPPVYSGGQLDALPVTTVTVEATTPPSVVGGDDPDTPELWDALTDYLEGWTWPGADTGRLRQAAATWRRFGSVLESSLTAYLDTAVTELRAQRSPEVEIAVGVTEDLKLDVAQLAFHCDELAEACEAYADQVDAVKELVRAILRDLAIEVGITAAVAGLASVFTFGSAAGAGAVVAGWRLAATARKVVGAFSAMKAVVRTAAVARLTRVADDVPALRQRFTRISEAANRARHEQFVAELRAQMGKPHTTDPQLSLYMNRLYRESADVGSGSTAAAVRHELATGEPVKGRDHVQKAQNLIVSLERWLKNHPTASAGDRAAAENVVRDMRDALAGR